MLIYSHTISTRLQYICKFIFQEQLGIGFSLTIDLKGFKQHEGPKINYSNLRLDGDVMNLSNHPLLFEKNIKMQNILCFETNHYKAFFKTPESDVGFDIFAASFYLLSRYEEYLTHAKDIYGRYPHENSIAFKEGFLQQPLVNIWINDFAGMIKRKFPSINFKHPSFQFTPTYDIDIAWSYKNKGLLRNLGGFLKSPSLERITVLTGLKKDPFNCYEYLRLLHHKYCFDPIYFFLVATSRSTYDKNISPYHHSMWQLIKKHAESYRIGLHPSWKSFNDPALIKKEKKIAETTAKIEITRSRQHYIKFCLPETFEHLTAAGITEDYSMGYGSINGFRASVASSFYWYNLESETVTALRLFPFCFMDANSFYEQKQNTADSLIEIMHYYEVCKNVNGQMITIFHNNFLGTDMLFEGWRNLYESFISQVQK